MALAGPMGAGKSTVGRILARRWGAPFRDLDAAIGDASAIFAAEGEAGFRARERAALAEAVTGEGVLALGGGTVVDPRNRALLAGWRVFVLAARASTLRERIGGGAGRPLAGELDALLAARAEAYAAAGEPVDTEGHTPEQVADLVEARCAST
ncbi:MAG: shikimate kinase [Myxococcota bacterium]